MGVYRCAAEKPDQQSHRCCPHRCAERMTPDGFAHRLPTGRATLVGHRSARLFLGIRQRFGLRGRCFYFVYFVSVVGIRLVPFVIRHRLLLGVDVLVMLTLGVRSEVDLKTGPNSGIFRFGSGSDRQNGQVPSPTNAERRAPHVLVIEDSDAIREMVVEALEDAGFAASAYPDGDNLEGHLEGHRPDAVILDVMLPGRDGFALIEVVRAWGDVGVIMLTARDGLPDRLRGLDGGADDYVVKPFEMSELMSRVSAVLRRRGTVAATIELGDLLVDRAAAIAIRAGQPLPLTATELKMLEFLIDQRGRIVSAAQILNAVWGYTAYDDNLVHVHLSSLRRKLEAHGPRIVHTVRGIGYRLQVST